MSAALAGQSYDVVVVGGGIAGMVAASRAAQLGRSVAVLEKGIEPKYLNNTRYTGGTLHVCLTDIMSSPETHRASIERATAGYARPDLAEAIAQDAARAVRWLQEQGVRFMKASAAAYQGWVIAPVGRTRPGLEWEGRSGDVLLRTLEAKLVERSGQVLRGHRARRLVMADGNCVGVELDGPNGPVSLGARAVVIADGGFQGNAARVGEFISSHPEKIRQRGAGTGVGDGLEMAVAAGAMTAGTDRFYGHLLSVDSFTNDMLWPYPYLDSTAVAGIVVDRSGRRIRDEGAGGVFLANEIVRLDDPLSATVIFDQAIWEGPSRQGLVACNPHLANEHATMYVADSVAALAEMAGLPVDGVSDEVDQYNAALESGRLSDLRPPRSTDRYQPHPIRTAPFYAVPVCAGITYTMGGIVTDASSRVLSEAGDPIGGLYAAGATTGGLEGGPRAAYVGGLVKGSVMGLRAAEHIAEQIRG